MKADTERHYLESTKRPMMAEILSFNRFATPFLRKRDKRKKVISKAGKAVIAQKRCSTAIFRSDVFTAC